CKLTKAEREKQNPPCFQDGQIGVKSWDVPNFTPGPEGAFEIFLSPAKSGWTRETGHTEKNTVGGSFTLPEGNSIGLNSITTYGSLTSVEYDWIPSGQCGTGHTRVIWGFNADPDSTPRVEANCFTNQQTHP